jgi:hypothetical protein
LTEKREIETENETGEREREIRRERERESLDTLIPGVPLNYIEKRILRYRERHEERDGGRERQRVTKTQRDSKRKCRNTED